MIEDRKIPNGDMIHMAKIVNHNTVAIHNKVNCIEEGLLSLGDCYNGHLKVEKRVRRANLLAFTGIGIMCFSLYKMVSDMDKKIKKLEDQMLYIKYIKDEDDDNDLK